MRAMAEQAAGHVLDVVPLVMATIRGHMRQFRDCELTLVQFRTLAFLNREPGASLSTVADYIGLTLPAMSRLVDGLVDRKLVSRQTPLGDRRRVTLSLTGRGRGMLESALEMTQERLADQLAGLQADDYRAIIRAMQILGPIFSEHQAHGPVAHAVASL